MFEGNQFVVDGDSGYSSRVVREVPFEGETLSSVQTAFNKEIARARIAVEWYLKGVKQLWSFVDSKRNFRLW